MCFQKILTDKNLNSILIKFGNEKQLNLIGTIVEYDQWKSKPHFLHSSKIQNQLELKWDGHLYTINVVILDMELFIQLQLFRCHLHVRGPQNVV